jgi:hypothetical protein
MLVPRVAVSCGSPASAVARRVGNLPLSSYDARGLDLNITGETMDASEQNRWKKAAAEAAGKLVETGMIVGLGTGSTASFVVSELGRRVSQEGLRIIGIPTSERTAEQARSLKIPLATLAEHTEIDLTIDGADEVERGTLYLIKGHGGALLREKSLRPQASAWLLSPMKQSWSSVSARTSPSQSRLCPLAGRRPSEN